MSCEPMRTRTVPHLVYVQWCLASRGSQQVHLERGRRIPFRQSIQGWKGPGKAGNLEQSAPWVVGQCYHHNTVLTVLKKFSVWTENKKQIPKMPLWKD